ncbi:MAG TPA: hypothetical protein VHU87_13100 [Rhizomicrobium sp.]|jgi:hypothetical protein|nr:hypothetical protein [Rhizomicrobium sp.]
MFKFFAIAMCVALSGSCATPDGAAWLPDAKTVAKLESVAKIPGGPGRAPTPLTSYARFYWGITTNGHRRIRGVFLNPALPSFRHRPGVYLSDGSGFIPAPMDGGCSVVNVIYDVQTAQVISIWCNGYA